MDPWIRCLFAAQKLLPQSAKECSAEAQRGDFKAIGVQIYEGRPFRQMSEENQKFRVGPIIITDGDETITDRDRTFSSLQARPVKG
jgi:hypothetical protein